MGKFDATPTKEFFINMLTKDIPLERAIIDLMDNSVDGARNVLISNGKDLSDPFLYEGFKIEIQFNRTEFIIKDNCGGFSKEAADEYAFKFGRPKNPSNHFGKGSVGRFGVGMKRALFKIGHHFIVESKCKQDHFIVDANVEVWRQSDEWKFEFSDINSTASVATLKIDGTYIKIDELYDAVKQDFTKEAFKNKLIDEIARTLNYSIKRGLEIYVNNIKVEPRPIELLISNESKFKLLPYYLEEDINGVNVKIYAGVGVPDPNLAGWYIYCNDRMMVERDKTNLTGWEGGEKFYNDTGVQKYHNKVAMFRGLVFFSSENPDLLPMTTTKWGVDENSTLYKSVRQKMINAMKIVLSNLNSLKNAEERKYIAENAKSIDIVSNDNLTLVSEFTFPKLNTEGQDEKLVRISYKVDECQVNKVKSSLKVSSNKEVGLRTFDYFIKMKEL